ncbi:glutamate--cysteine ligase regulatory subunit isoform X2 [Zootermopsis nevadensis]|uniref:GCS light chain n=1 Tax=Zootermopsis nevadensis TaxID=136037 RepID=A0A067REI4_ZOONE|nr:glutamate--cysteine ligase regulatory subunit isoform X2 [Zootermopsis nevadensis]KDR22286.1 Glutamate--cysteine ligase regulatory subunit [Zootermopsis nevadensis]
MLSHLPPSVKKICVHTGNILNLNEVKKKAGQNPTDELIESLRITLASWQPSSNEGDTIRVYRMEDGLGFKLDSEERRGLKVSVKVFISSLKKEALIEALDSVFTALHTSCIDSLVLAYPWKTEPSLLLPGLKELWQVLEEYVEHQKLISIGVSDVETDAFIALHGWARIKPSIIQINLASCCVVPPALQAFTKEHDVQLLTHSDPFEILPRAALNEVFGSKVDNGFNSVELHWALRFQVHVKCRGVLCSKGYLLSVHHLPGKGGEGVASLIELPKP